MKTTVLDALIAAVERAQTEDGATAAPALIWTDKEREWTPLLPLLAARLPGLLVLGPWVPGERTGPAIWVRCVLAGTIPEVTLPPGVPPILYLPGVGRADLRAVDECPADLKPIAELQYRSVLFGQKNGKDWTARAFLEGEGGLKLDVARDEATSRALRAAIGELAVCPVSRLRDKRLEAIDFNELVVPDMVRSLLTWMNDPKGSRSAWPAEKWNAFASECRASLKFDPAKDGELSAAELLGGCEHGWETVWQRFAEAPQHYPGIVALLEKAEPVNAMGSLYYRAESWPGATSREEEGLRGQLLALAKSPPQAAAKKIADLEAKHGKRRAWLWALLNRAPLARALEHLARIAAASTSPSTSSSTSALAESWVSEGWRIDAAALSALAIPEAPVDVSAVHAALRAVYLPWLEASAMRLQQLVGSAVPVSDALGVTEAGTCFLFADGLRFDVAKDLEASLRAGSAIVELGWRWAAMPTVTATAKPAVSPVAAFLGAGPSADFQASAGEGKPLTIERFRKLLETAGISVLIGDATGDPAGRAWSETGSLDKYGHEQGWKVARRVSEEVRELAARTRALLDAGWREVRIVTDHGWLLVPGDLPKVDLPKFLAESRWGRCASLKESVTPNLPLVPWRWDPSVWVAVAPGIATFYKGMEYAHGGVSLQECVIPVLTVRSAQATSKGSITSLKWTGLRCNVAVEGAAAGSHVDLRRKVADAATSILAKGSAKPVGSHPEVALYANDECEGEAAFVVLLGPDGSVVAKVQTTVGGSEG